MAKKKSQLTDAMRKALKGAMKADGKVRGRGRLLESAIRLGYANDAGWITAAGRKAVE